MKPILCSLIFNPKHSNKEPMHYLNPSKHKSLFTVFFFRFVSLIFLFYFCLILKWITWVWEQKWIRKDFNCSYCFFFSQKFKGWNLMVFCLLLVDGINFIINNQFQNMLNFVVEILLAYLYPVNKNKNRFFFYLLFDGEVWWVYCNGRHEKQTDSYGSI